VLLLLLLFALLLLPLLLLLVLQLELALNLFAEDGVGDGGRSDMFIRIDTAAAAAVAHPCVG